MNLRTRAIFLLAAGLLSGAAVIAPTAASADKPEKVTICHAAGRAGTDHYVTLTVGYNAVYGPGGHFNENGTPQAGHEQDYLGPCRTETTVTGPTTTVPNRPRELPPILIPPVVIEREVPTAPVPVPEPAAPTFNG